MASRPCSGVRLFQGQFPTDTLPIASLLESTGKFAGVDVSYSVPLAWGHSEALFYLYNILKMCVYFIHPAFVENNFFFFLCCLIEIFLCIPEHH